MDRDKKTPTNEQTKNIKPLNTKITNLSDIDREIFIIMPVNMVTCGKEGVKIFLQGTGQVDQSPTPWGNNVDALLVTLNGAENHL